MICVLFALLTAASNAAVATLASEITATSEMNRRISTGVLFRY